MDTLIMIPGLGSDAAVWKPTIAELGSAIPCQVANTLSDASLAEMVDRILADAPDRFALAGVSMGGILSMMTVLEAPERVTRLALFDTVARRDTPEELERRRSTNLAMSAASDIRALAAPAIAYMIDRSADREVHSALADMTMRVGVSTYIRQNEAVAARANLLPELTRIAVPTIVAVGANDLMTPIACSQAIADAIPDAELHVIPDCGHLPPIEKPRLTADLLRAWLR